MKNISVRILDKDYQVACPPNAETDLQLSAQYLDKQMKTIRRTGKVVGSERIAIMAGLNIAYTLLETTRNASAPAIPTPLPPSAASTEIEPMSSPIINEKLAELKNRIDAALSAQTSTSTQIREATRKAESLLWPEEEENALQVNALEVEY